MKSNPITKTHPTIQSNKNFIQEFKTDSCVKLSDQALNKILPMEFKTYNVTHPETWRIEILYVLNKELATTYITCLKDYIKFKDEEKYANCYYMGTCNFSLKWISCGYYEELYGKTGHSSGFGYKLYAFLVDSRILVSIPSEDGPTEERLNYAQDLILVMETLLKLGFFPE